MIQGSALRGHLNRDILGLGSAKMNTMPLDGAIPDRMKTGRCVYVMLWFIAASLAFLHF